MDYRRYWKKAEISVDKDMKKRVDYGWRYLAKKA